MSKRPESNDIELSYGDHLKDLQERPNDGTSSVYEQDEREIRRMGKRSQFKVGRADPIVRHTCP